MSLIFTGIDPTNLPDSPVTDESFYGPLSFGGKLYCWGETQSRSGVFTGFLVVYRSSDSGATWTRFLSAQKTMTTGWADTANHRVTFLLSDSGGAGLFFVDFDLNAETFGSPYGQFLASSTIGYHVRRLSTGDLVVVCGDVSDNVLWVKFSGGSWGTPVQVNTTTAALFRTTCVLDPNDTLWVTWWNPGDPNGRVRSVQSNGTLGSVVVISSTLTGSTSIGNGCYSTGNNGINFWAKAQDPSLATASERLWGTPIPTPTWHEEFIDDTNLINSDYGQMRVDGSGNLVADVIDGTNASSFDSGIVKATLSGTWTDTLEYDCNINYPANLTRSISAPSMNGISASDAGWIVRMSTHTTADIFTLVFVGNSSPPPPPPPPPTVTCVGGSGTVENPFTGSFTASGGTGPYTFAIINGSLPPGLSLNTSTGAVTGTPATTGAFTFRVQVTDANGLTATANCALGIAAVSSCPPVLPCSIFPPLDLISEPCERTGT